jgi:hypothetical protein
MGGAGPTPSPMQTPQPAAGLAQNSKVQVQMALDMLQQSLPGLGVTTPEGKAVLAALTTLSKTFGPQEAKSRELIPTEIMQLLASLPQAGGASPGQRQIAAAPPPGAGAPPLPM